MPPRVAITLIFIYKRRMTGRKHIRATQTLKTSMKQHSLIRVHHVAVHRPPSCSHGGEINPVFPLPHSLPGHPVGTRGTPRFRKVTTASHSSVNHRQSGKSVKIVWRKPQHTHTHTHTHVVNSLLSWCNPGFDFLFLVFCNNVIAY